MVFKFNPFRLLTRRLIAAYIALALAVYSCFFIYLYCLVLFGTLDKSNPPEWIVPSSKHFLGMSLESFQWILILCIMAIVYELIISIILFVGTIKKEASLCNVWIRLSPPVENFTYILWILLWAIYNFSATGIAFPFSLLIWFNFVETLVIRALVKELENLDLSRSSNMTRLLARVQQVLLQLHAPLSIHAA